MAESTTESGLPIKAVYGPADLDGFDPGSTLGEPGSYPFTRGVYPSMYTGRPWTMRQYAGFGTAAESNARYRELVANGTGGLSVAFDLPTQMGYDSDHMLASGEVGKVGVAIDSIDDMALLFDGLPLDEVSTSMTINAPASTLLLMYQLVAEGNGIPAAKLTGSFRFLKSSAPAIIERGRSDAQAHVPDVKTVDFVQRAEERGAADKDTMAEIRRMAFDEGERAPMLARRFKSVAFPVSDEDAQARVLGQLSSSAKKMAALLAEPNLPISHALAVEVEEVMGKLLEAIDAKLN